MDSHSDSASTDQHQRHHQILHQPHQPASKTRLVISQIVDRRSAVTTCLQLVYKQVSKVTWKQVAWLLCNVPAAASLILVYVDFRRVVNVLTSNSTFFIFAVLVV